MRTLLALALLLAALPTRAADQLTFAAIHVGKGYAGPVAVEVTWKDRTTRDVSTATGTITVYSSPPVGGTGGTVLFTRTLLPSGTAGELAGTVTATHTATPGIYYCEISIVDGSVTDTWHGSWVTEGR